MKIAMLGPIVKDIIYIDDKISTYPGGIPYYVGNALSQLGVDITIFASYAKKDHDFFRKHIQTEKLHVIPQEETIEMTMKYSSSNLNHRDHFNNEAASRINLSDVKDKLEEFDMIILGPLFHDNIDKEIFSAFKHKKLILGNFGMFTHSVNKKLVHKDPDNIISILKYLDYLFLDDKEAMFVAQKESLKEAAETIQAKIDKFIITKGSHGSNVFINRHEFLIPAFAPKKIVDPTGAGDTYLAGFIRSLELFDDPKKQGEFAAMVATMSIENKGSFVGSVDDVLRRLAKIKPLSACD